MAQFKMTDAQLEKLLESAQPQPAIMLQCGNPPSQQERVNAAWVALGEEMGFKPFTARPIYGMLPQYFEAEPLSGPENNVIRGRFPPLRTPHTTAGRLDDLEGV